MKIPPELLQLLESEKFCFLATSYRDRPHLSLMNFTYLSGEGIIILSSRADTTKVQHMEQNPAVALLLYNLEGSDGQPLSCSLHGMARVIDPEEDGFYRERHYQKNKDMGVFITGSHIRIIAVEITRGVIVDARDRVRPWTP